MEKERKSYIEKTVKQKGFREGLITGTIVTGIIYSIILVWVVEGLKAQL